MSELHRAYLNLGSNIQPEINLVKAIQLLRNYGEVNKISSAWESKSVGMNGPNYLNACLLFISPSMPVELKERVIRPIEAQLGRQRNKDKYAPRTIDIDIVLFDEEPYNHEFWIYAFVIVPLAEIHPTYRDPITNLNIAQTATHIRKEVWIEIRPEVLGSFG